MNPLATVSYMNETILFYDLDRPEIRWVAAEHKVLGEQVVVGTALIEMVRSAAHTIRPDSRVILSHALFIDTLRSPPHSRSLISVRVTPDGTRFWFQIRGCDGKNHVEGKINFEEHRTPGLVSIDLIKKGLAKEHNLVDLFTSPNIEVGAHWDCIRHIYIGESESLLFLSINQEYESEMDYFFLHPSLFDAALYLVFDRHDPGFFIPWMYRNMAIYGRMPSRFYSYCRLHHPPTPTTEFLSADFLLFNEQGSIFIEIKGFIYKRVQENGNK